MTSEVFDPTFFVPDVEFSEAPESKPGYGTQHRAIVPLVPARLLRNAASYAFVGVCWLTTSAVASSPNVDPRVLRITHATERADVKNQLWGAALQQLDELRSLPHDWDSYGAPPPAPAAIEVAHIFLESLFAAANAAGKTVPTPAVQASAARTVGFAWGSEDRTWGLEVEAHPDGVLTFVSSIADNVEVGTVETASQILGLLRV